STYCSEFNFWSCTVLTIFSILTVLTIFSILTVLTIFSILTVFSILTGSFYGSFSPSCTIGRAFPITICGNSPLYTRSSLITFFPFFTLFSLIPFLTIYDVIRECGAVGSLKGDSKATCDRGYGFNYVGSA